MKLAEKILKRSETNNEDSVEISENFRKAIKALRKEYKELKKDAPSNMEFLIKKLDPLMQALSTFK